MPSSDSSISEKEKRKKRKRKHESSSSDTDSSIEKRRKKDKKKKKKKKKHKKEKKQHKEKSNEECVDVPISFMSKSMAPMTKEEYDKKQSTVRRVFDESTGRHRLIKGDGEVIEEIVSRDRHKEINKQATKGDGDFFQGNVYKK